MDNNFLENSCIEIASDFVAYSDYLEIVELLYEDNKDEIYSSLNISNKEDFILILRDDTVFSLKEVEKAHALAINLTVSYLGTLSKAPLIAFAQEHYDSNFSLI